MINKILIVGPAWIGDMVMSQTLLKLLRQQKPNAEIHVLAPQWTFPLLARMPEVDNSLSSPFAHGELLLRKRYQFAKKLREMHYQQAIMLPNSLKSALIPFLAKIPKRTGWLGEYRFGLLNDIRYLDSKKIPTMQRRFSALAFSPDSVLPEKLPIPLLTCCHDQVDQTVKKHRLMAQSPILALCSGAEFGSSKRWPIEYYADIANQKLKEGWSVWLFGSKHDAATAELIQSKTQSRCENLTGKTNLSEAIDLLSLASAVVTNDSGLMHIAAALDRKVVAIYGSTSPDFTPPLTQKAQILQFDMSCRPCFKRVCPLSHHQCMKSITPDLVLPLITI